MNARDLSIATFLTVVVVIIALVAECNRSMPDGNMNAEIGALQLKLDIMYGKYEKLDNELADAKDELARHRENFKHVAIVGFPKEVALLLAPKDLPPAENGKTLAANEPPNLFIYPAEFYPKERKKVDP